MAGDSESSSNPYPLLEPVDPEVVASNADVTTSSLAQPPTLSQVLLDPRKVPCFREAMLVGIVGAFFGGGAFGLIKQDMRRVPNFAMGGFLVASTMQWLLCRRQYSAKRTMIRRAMSGDLDIKDPVVARQLKGLMEVQKEEKESEQ